MKNSQRSAFKVCLLPLCCRNPQSRRIKGALIMSETPRETKSQSQSSKRNLSTSETSDGDDRPAWSPSSFIDGHKNTPTHSSARSPPARSFCPTVHDSSSLQQSWPRGVMKGIRGRRSVDLLPLRGDEKNCRDGESLLYRPPARVQLYNTLSSLFFLDLKCSHLFM